MRMMSRVKGPLDSHRKQALGRPAKRGLDGQGSAEAADRFATSTGCKIGCDAEL